MVHNHSQSVADLRRESERTRAELSQTVETLKTKITDTAADIRHKVSPENIKAEVSDYVAEKGRHWLDNLKQQAMDNPMQTLAAGTAIAVPAFKMIRSVPASPADDRRRPRAYLSAKSGARWRIRYRPA